MKKVLLGSLVATTFIVTGWIIWTASTSSSKNSKRYYSIGFLFGLLLLFQTQVNAQRVYSQYSTGNYGDYEVHPRGHFCRYDRYGVSLCCPPISNPIPVTQVMVERWVLVNGMWTKIITWESIPTQTAEYYGNDPWSIYYNGTSSSRYRSICGFCQLPSCDGFCRTQGGFQNGRRDNNRYSDDSDYRQSNRPRTCWRCNSASCDGSCGSNRNNDRGNSSRWSSGYKKTYTYKPYNGGIGQYNGRKRYN